MRLIDLLRAVSPGFSPKMTKVHLATPNQGEDPFDELLAGRFERWQKWQTQRNFERDLVLSLIKLPKRNRWLFAGIYRSGKPEFHEARRSYHYPLEELQEFAELKARLVVRFIRPGRQSYLLMEKWEQEIEVSEWKAEKVSIAEFPGFKSVDLSKQELEIIVRDGTSSWRTALSSVAGVYLISDIRSGKLYVGSATGEGGIWQRWSQYANSGHAGNIELIELMKVGGVDSMSGFRFSILEIADPHESPQGMLKRESHWKRVLMTRVHGFNSN